MKRIEVKSWWAGVLTLIFGIAGVFVLVWLKHYGYTEGYKVTNSTFALRVMTKSTLAFNYSYLFQSRRVDEDSWTDVYQFTSDPDSPREMIEMVDENTAFFRSNRSFGVTRDAGRTWTTWDKDMLRTELQDRFYCTWIRSAKLDPTGRGELVLRGCSPSRILTTSDFGVTWK